MKSFLLYIFIVSFVAVVLTIVDKHNARKQAWRISERTLFITAGFGGSLSMLVTMRLIRHKTKHKRFMIGLPLIIICQFILSYIIFIKL